MRRALTSSTPACASGGDERQSRPSRTAHHQHRRPDTRDVDDAFFIEARPDGG
ncbi:MAG: hypothetical protein ACLR0N_09550 [Bilophila wadsworthia]